jgi:amino acid permease
VQALASAGIIPGMLTCLFSGSVAAFGLYLLSLCTRQTPHRKSSFFAVAQRTFPRAAIFFDAAIAIKCFGVSIRSALSPAPRGDIELMVWVATLSSSRV